MKAIVTAGILGLTLCVSIRAAHAELSTLAPSRVIAFSADESGRVQVALMFDVSEIARADVGEALLEWNLSAMESEGEYDFSVSRIDAAWDHELASRLEVADDAGANWTFEALDYERNGGGLVRFEITEFVRDWVEGNRGNFGVVISTKDLGVSDIRSDLSGPRLTIRYRR